MAVPADGAGGGPCSAWLGPGGPGRPVADLFEFERVIPGCGDGPPVLRGGGGYEDVAELDVKGGAAELAGIVYTFLLPLGSS